jgi:hypothetical protein
MLWPADEREHCLGDRVYSISGNDVVIERGAISSSTVCECASQRIEDRDLAQEGGEIAIRHSSCRRPDIGCIETRSRVVDLLKGEEEEGFVLPVIDFGDSRGTTNAEAGTIRECERASLTSRVPKKSLQPNHLARSNNKRCHDSRLYHSLSQCW